MFETRSDRLVFCPAPSAADSFRASRTPFQAHTKSVRDPAGMAFTIIPESRSHLSRIPVRLHPGIVFTIRRIPQYVTLTGENEESAADQFAVLVTSPQRVVDMLRNAAQSKPESNAIHLPKNADPHPTAYERAMAIAEGFPGQVNLEGFPPPSSPSVTVKGIGELVPVVPSPVARSLSLRALAPGMR